MRIPVQTDHRFQSKPITDSGPNRSLIPAQTDRRFLIIAWHIGPRDLGSAYTFMMSACTADPDPKHISTSYVERQNLTMRMSMRRFTRLTDAFSKRVQHHFYHVALYVVWYNFCRIHKTLHVTPAMSAGLSDTLRDVEWIVSLVEELDSKPGPRGPYKKRQVPD